MDGELVEVAFVGDEVQATMIQALLEQHEIPSIQEQVGPSGRQLGTVLLSPGGSRKVMVHAHRVEEARAVMTEATAEGEREAPDPVNARYPASGRWCSSSGFGCSSVFSDSTQTATGPRTISRR
jgi:hypothetical protein